MEFFFEVIADSKRDSMIRAMSAFIAARTCEERNMQEVLFNYHISEDSNTLLFDKLILICRDDHGPNQGKGSKTTILTGHFDRSFFDQNFDTRNCRFRTLNKAIHYFENGC